MDYNVEENQNIPVTEIKGILNNISGVEHENRRHKEKLKALRSNLIDKGVPYDMVADLLKLHKGGNKAVERFERSLGFYKAVVNSSSVKN